MQRRFASALGVALLWSASTQCFADFQYTENGKITGGALAGAMKFVGAFSKDAKQASQPTNSTVSVKGNRMRRETDQGTAEIYDLDGRRIIHLDLKRKTYSVMTFEEMRAQMEEAKKKAAEQRAKKGQDPQVKITPKIQVTQGTGTKQILNYTAKEVKTRVDMEMESQDPQHPGTANMWVSSDSWVAPVKGYDELQRFYVRMAKELDWLPGAALGGNAQISPAMVELRKSTAKLTGLPLLQYSSVGMGAVQPANASTAGQSQQQQQPPQSGNPLSKGLGGIFGKKKKDDSQQQTSDSTSGAPAAGGGSLMDMTIESLRSPTARWIQACSTSRPDSSRWTLNLVRRRVRPPPAAPALAMAGATL